MSDTAQTDTREDEPGFEEMTEDDPGHPSPAPHAPEARYGVHRPGFSSRVGLAIGRALPPGRTGLRLAGAARPLALSGVKHGVADVKAFGLKLRLHPLDNLSEKRAFMTPQCFDPAELKAIRAAMGPGKVFIDIGANAGLYALVAAKAGGPSSRVIAVEPQREMRRRIAWNARANGLEALEITGIALSDYEGESLMKIVGRNKGMGRLEGPGAKTHRREQGSGEAVRVTTLPTLLAEMKADRLDAMKIDVEGAEVSILQPYFSQTPRAAWPELIVLERAQVNNLSREADAVSLACSKGYAVETETRMNAILRLKAR